MPKHASLRRFDVFLLTSLRSVGRPEAAVPTRVGLGGRPYANSGLRSGAAGMAIAATDGGQVAKIHRMLERLAFRGKRGGRSLLFA